MRVRPCEVEDHSAIVGIYNHYIANTHFTFDVSDYTVASRQPWFAGFDGSRYLCLVIEDPNRQIAGYACSSRFKEKSAYETSVEVSIYLHPHNTSRGLGKLLYEPLFEHLEQHDVHRAYAGIALPNEPSIRFHQKMGFVRKAHFAEVGRKFDRFWDVVWLEKNL
ncbi:MAG: GNAT family N-acetyltransferase [Proteobacteria bacterium]|nr:GNAT family N-acetyltransferase [Pseudomonadota bacterium]